MKDNRSAAHTENHTEAINKDIEAHIDHQDNYQSRQQPQQQSNTQQQTTEQQHSKYQHTSIYEELHCFRCGQYGHYKRGCGVNLDHSKRFKLQEAYDAGPVLGLHRKINGPSIKNNLVKIPPGLYGQPTETSVTLEGIETGALLDTGSTVSTISESCYQQWRKSTTILWIY